MMIVQLLTNGLSGRGLPGSTYYTWQDAVAICISAIATGLTQEFVGIAFGISQHTVSDVLGTFLQPLAIIASSLWVPVDVTAEADRCSFAFFPQAVAAIDSTPIRVADPQSLGWLAGALWTHKHHIPSFNLHVAVAANGICVAILAFMAGGRHDKRALDETNAYLRFRYIARSDADGSYLYNLYAVLLDAGYRPHTLLAVRCCQAETY
jgi:hypothetical protein